MPVPARAIAERRVAEHFLAAGAVGPGSAIDYEPGWPLRARAFARLKDKAILKSAPRGWYIDVAAWDDRRKSRRKRALVAMAAVAAAGALAALL